ncbi:hypothetical protein Q1695_007839 [Nippostrongylus brasiliensis]|nr:hypothetical protein Q1695_007839 [Nippostrongylus brasiliensis]
MNDLTDQSAGLIGVGRLRWAVKSGRQPVFAVDHRELGEKLNRLVSRSSIGSSLPSLSSLHSSSSLTTMPSAKVADGSFSNRPMLKNGLKQKSGEDRQRDIELYKILRGKKAELEELLRARVNELRSVCLKEGVSYFSSD